MSLGLKRLYKCVINVCETVISDNQCMAFLHVCPTGWFTFTLGQRARIGGQKDPWFVVDKDITTGEIFIVSYTSFIAHGTFLLSKYSWNWAKVRSTFSGSYYQPSCTATRHTSDRSLPLDRWRASCWAGAHTDDGLSLQVYPPDAFK